MQFLRIAFVAVLLTVLWTSFSAAAPDFSAWSPAVNLGSGVNADSFDSGPTLSKDRRSLYFVSNRPGGLGVNDIWVSRRSSVEAPWGTPMNLGPAINTGFGEAGPALSRDGHLLFFSSNRPGYGSVDIWVSYREHVHDDFDWQPAVNAGAGVNSFDIEQDPSFFANDDAGVRQILFARGVAGGGGDIFVSEFLPDGTLGPSVLVPELNTPFAEAGPSVRFDGLEVFFWSNRPGGVGQTDLWSATRPTVFDPWSAPANLGPLVNSTAVEGDPEIASDRETLYFRSNRGGGTDLYVTTRTKHD